MIKALAFDFGGTLFSTHKMGEFTPAMKNIFIAHLKKELSINEVEAENIYESYLNEWHARRKRGGDLPHDELSSADLLKTALKKHNNKLEEEKIIELLNAFHSEEATLFTPLDHVIETLNKLKQKGLRLYVLSNNPWPEAIWAAFRRYKIDGLFEEVIVSSMVGVRKPHAPAFMALLKDIELPACEVMFVGDSYRHDIETPKKMGMKTCLCHLDGLLKNDQDLHAKEADFYIEDFRDLLSITVLVQGPALKA